MLVGDPDQLASVEAGAVLGDLVDAASQVGGRDAGDEPALPGDERHRAAGRGGAGRTGADALEVLRSDDTPEVELVEVADGAALPATSWTG